jgi:class 3 adenylate cyclase
MSDIGEGAPDDRRRFGSSQLPLGRVAAHASRPVERDTRRMTAIVVFTEGVGSTEPRGRLGDEAARESHWRHDRLLSDVLEAPAGRVVEGLGGGVVATFAGRSGAWLAIEHAVDRLNGF